MKRITDLSKEYIRRSIVTLGKFDGNHIGHRLLFDTAVRYKEEGDNVVVFTFDIPPAKIVNEDGGTQVRTIVTPMERWGMSYPDGVDYVVEFPFNEKTRSMLPEEFVRDVLVEHLDVKMIVVGEDYCFGKNRSGNVETLKQLGETYGFTVLALKKVTYCLKGSSDPKEVSSTLIKEQLALGNLEDANAMLGSPFTITAEVQHGKELGRTIGFPTTNFATPADKILPPNGVYATTTQVDGTTYYSITNVGVRPTFDDGIQKTVETNLFDFTGELYGKIVSVRFHAFIRPEVKFSSAEELRGQIQKDVEDTKAYFAAHPVL